MSLNKFKNVNTGYDLFLEIGGDNLKIRHLDVTDPINVLQVNNLTVNDSLNIICDDLSSYNLTTANNGNLGDILSTDGNGNTFWSAVPTPPLSGITYSGVLPAEVGRVLQVSNPTATTCDKTSILETLTEIKVEKAIQLTANKITSSYVPVNSDDLTNKLYVDNLPFPGIIYNGILPSEVGRILQISNTAGSACDKTSILESLTEITVEKPIQLTANKITTTYIPVNPADLTNKLYVDSLQIPVSGSGQVLYLNYSESTIPPFLPLTNLQLTSIIGGSFTTPSITYAPSQNTNTSLLTLVPNLSLAQYILTFTIGAVSTKYPIAQFAIPKSDISGIGNYINPGIWAMNIYAKADSNADRDKIRLKYYLLGRQTVGGLYDNLVTLGSDNLYILDQLAERIYELNLYIQNPIDVTIYDLFQVVVIAENINATNHTALVYFQSSNTYSHIHTNLSQQSTISINSVGTGESLISSNINPDFYLKSLIGSGISLTNTTNEITLTNSLPSTLISLTNSGSGNSILNSTTNPNFTTKGIIAGSNITITDSGTDLTINSSAGGGTYTFQNGGTGTSLVASTSTITDFKPVSLTAGSNVTIAGSGTNNLTISSAGALGTNTINIAEIATSASTYYPVFNNNITGVTSVLNTDSGGLKYVPTSNLLTTGAMNSGIYTSTIVPPNIGFVGHCTSANKIQTTDGSAFSSQYYLTFCPLSTSATSQEVITDSSLSYIPNQNKLTTALFNGSIFTSTTAIPSIGFVGASTSASKIQTTDGSAFTSPYFLTFVPQSTSQDQQSVSTDISLAYTPNSNTLGLVATTKYTGNTFTSNNVGLTAGFVGTCSNALEVAQTNVESFTATYYPMLSSSSASSTTLNPSEVVSVDGGLSYKPDSNTLTASIFSGNLTGNSSTATNISAVATNQILYQSATNTTGVLAQGTLGQFLKSNGALAPTWEASRNFTMSFGGRITLATGTEYLTPNKWADVASASIIASSYLTQWRSPIACSITGWSSTVQSTGASQLSILLNSVAGTAITGIGTSTSQSGTIVARAISANDLIEIKILNSIAGAVLITLYFS
jgi:hypothetical protein